MPTAVVCVMGLPGAGKSSLCHSLVRSEELLSLLRSIVSGSADVELEWIAFDKIEATLRPNGTVDFDPTIWHKARNRVEDMVREFRYERESKDVFRVLLLDDNFYYASMRRRFKPNGIIFLDIGIDACKQQNKHPRDSGTVPEHVITRMDALLDVPRNSRCCPIIRISLREDAFHSVVHACDFWRSVYESSAVQLSRQHEMPIRVTDTEHVLNQFEVMLRKAVHNLINKDPFSGRDMRRISQIKRHKLDSLKKILRDPACMDGLQAAVRLECEFIDELVQIV